MIHPDALLDARGAIVSFQTGEELPNYTGLTLALLGGYSYILWLSLNPDGTRKWQVVHQGSQLVMSEIDIFLKRNQDEQRCN